MFRMSEIADLESRIFRAVSDMNKKGHCFPKRTLRVSQPLIETFFKGLQ